MLRRSARSGRRITQAWSRPLLGEYRRKVDEPQVVAQKRLNVLSEERPHHDDPPEAQDNAGIAAEQLNQGADRRPQGAWGQLAQEEPDRDRQQIAIASETTDVNSVPQIRSRVPEPIGYRVPLVRREDCELERRHARAGRPGRTWTASRPTSRTDARAAAPANSRSPRSPKWILALRGRLDVGPGLRPELNLVPAFPGGRAPHPAGGRSRCRR